MAFREIFVKILIPDVFFVVKNLKFLKILQEISVTLLRPHMFFFKMSKFLIFKSAQTTSETPQLLLKIVVDVLWYYWYFSPCSDSNEIPMPDHMFVSFPKKFPQSYLPWNRIKLIVPQAVAFNLQSCTLSSRLFTFILSLNGLAPIAKKLASFCYSQCCFLDKTIRGGCLHYKTVKIILSLGYFWKYGGEYKSRDTPKRFQFSIQAFGSRWQKFQFS